VTNDPIPNRQRRAHDTFELSHAWRFGVHSHARSLTKEANRTCLR
jgi:hypothetical protein